MKVGRGAEKIRQKKSPKKYYGTATAQTFAKSGSREELETLEAFIQSPEYDQIVKDCYGDLNRIMDELKKIFPAIEFRLEFEIKGD